MREREWVDGLVWRIKASAATAEYGNVNGNAAQCGHRNIMGVGWIVSVRWFCGGGDGSRYENMYIVCVGMELSFYFMRLPAQNTHTHKYRLAHIMSWCWLMPDLEPEPKEPAASSATAAQHTPSHIHTIAVPSAASTASPCTVPAAAAAGCSVHGRGSRFLAGHAMHVV